MVITLLARFQPQLETAIQAIGSTTKTPLTVIVKAADLRRDNSFRSLRDHVKAGLNRENETYRSACEALWPEFEKKRNSNRQASPRKTNRSHRKFACRFAKKQKPASPAYHPHHRMGKRARQRQPGLCYGNNTA